MNRYQKAGSATAVIVSVAIYLTMGWHAWRLFFVLLWAPWCVYLISQARRFSEAEEIGVNMSIDMNDLKRYGIQMRGTFNRDGMPINWAVNRSLISDPKHADLSVLEIRESGDVFVCGLFSEELTRERKQAIA